MNKATGYISVIVFIAACFWIWHLYSKPKVKTAQSLEGQGKYAAAYEEYAKVIVGRSEKFKAPALQGATSGSEVQKWLNSVISSYISYRTSQPKETDCTIAYRKLRELESQLNILEHTFKQEVTRKLASSDFVDFWNKIIYSNQKTLPESGRKDAEAAFASHLSIVRLKGDFSSHIKGVLYNLHLDRAVPFEIHHGTLEGPGFLLAPGDWVILSRVVPELSEPRDKLYREARAVFGRYAATFFTVPEEPYAMLYHIELQQAILR
jgi:hypothetical protein